MENKEKSPETTNLENMTAAFDAMSKYAFWVGVQRGVMSCMNTIMLRYTGMSMEDYQKKMVKTQVHSMAPVSQIVNMLAQVLKECSIMAQIVEADAQKAAANENNPKEEPKPKVIIDE